MLEHERLIHAYGKWLDTMGNEGELYTWSIGKYSFTTGVFLTNDWPTEVGIRIYDDETALAFKLKFGL